MTSLRENGVEALAVAALAVLTGSSASVHPVASLDELMPETELAHLSRTPAKFDEAELSALSAKTLHQLPYRSRGRPFARPRDRRADLLRPSGSRFAAISSISPMRPNGGAWCPVLSSQ